MSTHTTVPAPRGTTFVLVHGSGTSSHMWGPVQRALALSGHRSFAIDLPGHGEEAQYSVAYQSPQDLEALRTQPSSLSDVTLDDNVEALESAVRTLGEHGPIVLVAASLGGVTATALANRHPELIDRLVYVSAWACATKANPIEYMGEPEFEKSLLPGLAGLNIDGLHASNIGRANYRTADEQQLRLLKAATMEDVDDERFMAFLNLMQPDESLAVMLADARVDPRTWGTVPRTFIRLRRDRSLPLAMQDRLIREADRLTPQNRFRVRTLDSSHAGFVYQGERVAHLLVEP